MSHGKTQAKLVGRLIWIIFQTKITPDAWVFLNPLTAKDVYLHSLIGRICRCYSAFHGLNHEKRKKLLERR